MISVESHSKQIKLLNDYIISLQKQISSAKKEQEEMQKGSGVSNDEQRRINEEVVKLRNENGQLKYAAYKGEEQGRRVNALERELAVTREQLSKERQERQVLEKENGQLRQGNSGHEVRKRTTEQQLEKRRISYEQQRQKLQLQLQDQRKTAALKQRRCDELTQLLTQQKKNAASRLFNLEVTNNEVVRLKNETISKLTRELDEMKSHHSRELASVSETRLGMNDQVRDLVRQLNDSRIEVQNLRREIGEGRSAGDRKNEELANAMNNLQAKSGELDSYIRKSNEQKNNLMKIIDRLEEEKRALERLNESNQGPKLLAEVVRERDELRGRLAAREEQLDGVQRELREAAGHQQHLVEQLQQAGQTIQQMDQRIIYEISQNENLDKLLFTSDQQLADKTKQMQELVAAKQAEESRLLEIIKNLELERDSKLDSLNSTSQQVKSLNSTVGELKAQIVELNRTIEADKQSAESRLKEAHSERHMLESRLRQMEKTAQVSKQEAEIERSRLNAEIESLSQQLEAVKASKDNDLESEGRRLMGELDSLRLQLKTAEQTIETNRKQSKIQQNKLSSQIENLTHQLTSTLQLIQANQSEYSNQHTNQQVQIQSLTLQLQTAHKTIETNRNQYIADRKRHQAELQEFSASLKDAEKRGEKYRLKVEELTRNLKELQAQQRGQIKISYSEADIEALTSKFTKTITDLKITSQSQLYHKDQEIQQLKQTIQKTIERGESKLTKLQQQWSAKQQEWQQQQQKLQKQIESLIKEKQILQDEYTRSSTSSIIIDTQTAISKDLEIDALKHTIVLLESANSEQKIVIENLSNLQAEMHLEIQSLEASNTMLRKQVIGAINSEETSRKELIETRSRKGSVLNNSRININDISYDRQLAHASTIVQRRVKANSLYGNLLDGRLNNSCINGRNRKKSTQLMSSLVDEFRGLGNERAHLQTDYDDKMGDDQ